MVWSDKYFSNINVRTTDDYCWFIYQIQPWKFAQFWMQKQNDSHKIRSLVLNREAKWAIFVLIRAQGTPLSPNFPRVPPSLPVCDKRRLQTCRLADLQTCRLADLQTRRFADLHFLWQGFALFTVGESQSMSEANNSASGLQTQQCPIRQVTGNPCRGRLNIGRTVT